MSRVKLYIFTYDFDLKVEALHASLGIVHEHGEATSEEQVTACLQHVEEQFPGLFERLRGQLDDLIDAQILEP